jgi:hypothetical protein
MYAFRTNLDGATCYRDESRAHTNPTEARVQAHVVQLPHVGPDMLTLATWNQRHDEIEVILFWHFLLMLIYILNI